MLLINHMVLQLRAGREQKAWQPFEDWHLVSKSSFFFCSSLSAHFHPSIPSLFNWLSVKVLLSASTCPCHSKQRQPGDTALCVVSVLSSPLPSSLTLFYFFLLLIFSPVSPLPLAFLPFSLSLPLSFFVRQFFFIHFPTLSIALFECLGLVTNLYHHCLCWASPFLLFVCLFAVTRPTEYVCNSFSILLSCETNQNYDLNQSKMSLTSLKEKTALHTFHLTDALFYC